MSGVLSPAAALAIGSAAVAAFVATTVARLVAAPGWRDARWVPLIAWSATAFAACSAVPLLTASPHLVIAAQGWRYAFAGVHVVGWLRHSARPLGLGAAAVRALTVALVALAVAMAIPGAAYRAPIDARAVAWLGSVYHLPTPRPLSHVSAAVLVSMMLGLGVLQLRAARRGAPGARGHAFVGLLLGAGGIHAELVAFGVAPAPDVLAPAAIIPAVVVASVTASRFVAEARELSALRVRLERRIRGRTRALALSREALRRTEALASLGRIARRAAHEVNNPAASVIANLGWARDQLGAGGPPPEIAAALRDALESARRVRVLGQRLTELGEASPAEARAPVPLGRAVGDALAIARARVPGADAVPVEVGALDDALADPPVLVRALASLLENALRAAVARPPGRVAVQAERAGGRVCLRIVDGGHGMDRAVLDRLGEPFFTTRPFESHGLGVATARALAATLEAELRFESAPGEGTRAILDLPAPPAPPRTGGAA